MTAFFKHFRLSLIELSENEISEQQAKLDCDKLVDHFMKFNSRLNSICRFPSKTELKYSMKKKWLMIDIISIIEYYDPKIEYSDVLTKMRDEKRLKMSIPVKKTPVEKPVKKK